MFMSSVPIHIYTCIDLEGSLGLPARRGALEGGLGGKGRLPAMGMKGGRYATTGAPDNNKGAQTLPTNMVQ